MPLPIENYGLIGNTRTAALVGTDGSIDWLCMPRFDAPSCFAALLGTAEHGRWLLAPVDAAPAVTRSYRSDTLVLETRFETPGGVVVVTDCMPVWGDRCDLVRIVECTEGSVAMRMELVIRPSYGIATPWVRRVDDALLATAGPDSLELRTPVNVTGENMRSVASFTIRVGQRIPFVLTWFASHEARPVPIDADAAVAATERYWRRWCGQCTYDGRWSDVVRNSLMILKALTYGPTGGIVAAVTTSLPELIGGVRNWDYRYCWVRDATFTLYSLLLAGYRDEGRDWRRWLLRAAAGHPGQMQTLYGVAGERQMTEMTIPWLPGYQDSAPVRVGNAAATQFQLDIYGELMDTMHVARTAGLDSDADAWSFQRTVVTFLESNWQRPDSGIWEARREPQHYVYSKVMAWLAMDRAVKAVEEFGLDGPVERWRSIRAQIHAQVCERGYDPDRASFVQYYGSKELDASLLLLAQVGFLPPDDPRMRGTIEAIERELVVDGLVARYRTAPGADGLPGGEGYFLPCSFWLADCLLLLGRTRDAEALFERLVALRNDVGLLSEEYDPHHRRALGNIPQALTHVALVNTARNLSHAGGPTVHRSTDCTAPAPEAKPAPQHRRGDTLAPDTAAPARQDLGRRKA